MNHILATITSQLERTPGVLRSLLAQADHRIVTTNYGPGTWSAYEVVGHLIIGEREDWIPRLRIILNHGTSRPFDPFPHDAAIPPSSGRPLDSLLSEFTSLRESNLAELRSFELLPRQFELRGRHPALGEVTLGQLLATWAAHDLHHIRQACLAMAWQLRDEVGPWRAYINTFDRG